MSAMREGDWKLIEWLEDGRLELYNLRRDPSEMIDLARQEASRATAMRKRLEAWRRETGAAMPVQNPHFDPKIKEAR